VGDPLVHVFSAGPGKTEIEMNNFGKGFISDSLLSIFSPVCVVGEKVQIDFDNMKIGESYVISYRGTKRFFIRNDAGEIEVYKAAK